MENGTEKTLSPALRSWLQLLRTYHRVQRELQKVLTPRGVTTAQFDVLAHLACSGDGLTQSELAATLAVTKGNVVGLIDRLAERGLLERRADPEDRRVHRLELTAEGSQLVGELLPAYQSLVARFYAGITPAETDALTTLLRRVEALLPPE
jgi:DNA-binding MarR family transcriptional regulator